jgi:hypothetical protein
MSHVGLQDVNSGSPGSGCYAPARPSSAPFPDGPGAAVVTPQDEMNAGQPLHHQKFIAILLPPLVLLAALAAGRIRSNVTEGVRAGRMNTLASWRR